MLLCVASLTLLDVLCSLLCRTFDSNLAEVCWQEGVRLLAYSPLAMGLLTVSHLAYIHAIPAGCPTVLR